MGIDYKQDDINGILKEVCPNGVDVYFDNVGGAVSETIFRRLALGARIPVCGQVSQYNLAEPELAPRNLGFLVVFRARLEGFLITTTPIASPKACVASAPCSRRASCATGRT